MAHRTGGSDDDGRVGGGAGGTGGGAQPGVHRQRSVRADRRVRPADQSRRAQDRLRPQVQRHHDRQSALVDLADRCRHRRAAPGRGRNRGQLRPVMVPRRPPPRLCFDQRGRRSAGLRALDGQRTERQGHRARDQPAVAELVARRHAHRLSHDCPRRWPQAGFGSAQARGRQLGQAAPDHRQGHLSRRRRRLSRARVRPHLPGLGRRRRAAPADLWRLQRWRPRMDPRRSRDPVQRRARSRLGDEGAGERGLSLRPCQRDGHRAHHPQGPRQQPRRLARWPADRLCRL